MKKIQSMKIHTISRWFIAFTSCILILTATSCNNNDKFDYQIEGIHYLNNYPVKIGIKDGKIAAIEKINKLSNENEAVFVAPGLIDNQVNGYRGNSFIDTGKDLTAEGMHAGNLIKKAAQICGGGGGGRPEMAQAGGKDSSKLSEAFEAVREMINN